jgi:hypothetical protein
VQESGDGVPDLRVTVIGRPGQVVGEAVRLTDRIAVPVEPVGGEVIGVGVDTGHAVRAGALQRDGRDDRALPGRGQVPASAFHVEVDG